MSWVLLLGLGVAAWMAVVFPIAVLFGRAVSEAGETAAILSSRACAQAESSSTRQAVEFSSNADTPAS